MPRPPPPHAILQDIIAQRSEVESFFLEALEQVREEVHKERNRPPPAGPERSNRDLGGGGGGNTFLTGVGEEVCAGGREGLCVKSVQCVCHAVQLCVRAR